MVLRCRFRRKRGLVRGVRLHFAHYSSSHQAPGVELAMNSGAKAGRGLGEPRAGAGLQPRDHPGARGPPSSTARAPGAPPGDTARKHSRDREFGSPLRAVLVGQKVAMVTEKSGLLLFTTRQRFVRL